MNRTPDVERVLREYLADDGLAAPDFILDDVAARISRQPRRFVRFPGRTNVTTPVKLIAGLAAALVVAVVGYSLLPKSGGVGGPATTPPASAQPTATAVAAVALPEGTLAAGRYRIDLSPIDPGLAVVADIPAGWIGHPEFTAIGSPDVGDDSDGVLIAFMEADGLFSDPCHWDLDGTGAIDQPGDVEVGPTVGDLVTALKASTSYTSSTPKPVTLGRFEGQELELQLPGDDVLTTCDQHGESSPFDGPAYFVISGKNAGWYAQGPENRWQLFIVDVEGTRLVAFLSYFPGSPEADLGAARAIVESFEFTP